MSTIAMFTVMSSVVIREQILWEVTARRKELATTKNTKYPLLVSPIFYISIFFILSWGHCKSQKKLETMLMQNFGGKNKAYYGI